MTTRAALFALLLATAACTPGQILNIPINHGEGNYFTTADELRKLEQNRQIVFRYVDAAGVVTDAANPNANTIATSFNRALRIKPASTSTPRNWRANQRGTGRSTRN